MIAQLTPAERRAGMMLDVCLALGGLVMAAASKQDPMGLHGFMALALGLGLVFAVGGTLENPAPDPARLQRYYDDPVKAGWPAPPKWSSLNVGA